jgi:hypothetical protein
MSGRMPDASSDTRTGATAGSRNSSSASLARGVLGKELVVSRAHEILVELVRNRPDIVRELLRDRRDLALGEGVAELASIDLSQATPPEYRCDAFVVFRERDHHTGGAIVEVQLNTDPAKLFAWPSYVTVGRQRYRCPVVLVVITPDRAVARWASAPIELGHPGFVLRPIVLGPAQIPRITSADPASPELAVMSALAHPEVDVAKAALLSTGGLPDERRKLYWDLIFDALTPVLRAALEEVMAIENYKPSSDFGARWSAFIEQRFSEGRAEGKAEGKADGLRSALRKQLVLKFGPLSEAIEDRINAATVEEIDRYLERILSAPSLGSVFE